MDDEINDIEQWAQIFTDPTKLAATVSKHFLFHKTEIQGDISSLESDWDSKLYFKAGEDLADLMTLAIGPIEAAEVSLESSMAVPNFVAGLLYGLTGDYELDELQTCMKDTGKIAKDAQKFFHDLVHFHFFRANKDVLILVKDLLPALKSCKNMKSDLDAIQKWYMIFEDPRELGHTTTRNYFLNREDINKEIASLKSGWSSKNFFAAGQDTADIMVDLLGEVPIVKPTYVPLIGITFESN